MFSMCETGFGICTSCYQATSIEDLVANRHEANMQILQSMREDMQSDALLSACEEDALLGRMSMPRVLQVDDLVHQHLSPRFGVVQGAVHVFPFFIT